MAVLVALLLPNAAPAQAETRLFTDGRGDVRAWDDYNGRMLRGRFRHDNVDITKVVTSYNSSRLTLKTKVRNLSRWERGAAWFISTDRDRAAEYRVSFLGGSVAEVHKWRRRDVAGRLVCRAPAATQRRKDRLVARVASACIGAPSSIRVRAVVESWVGDVLFFDFAPRVNRWYPPVQRG